MTRVSLIAALVFALLAAPLATRQSPGRCRPRRRHPRRRSAREPTGGVAEGPPMRSCPSIPPASEPWRIALAVRELCGDGCQQGPKRSEPLPVGLSVSPALVGYSWGVSLPQKDYESEGRRFESCWAHQPPSPVGRPAAPPS